MKKVFYSLVLFSAFGLLTSCATIVGGNKYWAHVEVSNHPSANITCNGEVKGKGTAVFKVKRTQAKRLSIMVKEEGCDEQTFSFTRNTFRGWAFAGTIVTWTGLISGIYVPWGVIVDLANGALVKPNVNEKGVSKIDYKNFKYVLEYDKCATNNFGENQNSNKMSSKLIFYTEKFEGENLSLFINGNKECTLKPDSYFLAAINQDKNPINVCLKSDSDEYCESITVDPAKTKYFEAMIDNRGKVTLYEKKSQSMQSSIDYLIEKGKIEKIESEIE
jgi:hypothetical protein